jgi:hypothetical protein
MVLGTEFVLWAVGQGNYSVSLIEQRHIVEAISIHNTVLKDIVLEFLLRTFIYRIKYMFIRVPPFRAFCAMSQQIKMRVPSVTGFHGCRNMSIWRLATATQNLYFLVNLYFMTLIYIFKDTDMQWDHLCGIVVRVPGCRPKVLGSSPGATRFSE